MRYNLVQLGDEANITVVIDGEMYVASSDHPQWNLILQKVLAGDKSVVNVFNPIQEVARRFTLVSDRVSISGNRVFFDGDPVDNALTQQIVEFLNTDQDFLPLVNFYEKLATNPEKHSREQLYRWLIATGGFTITPDGDVLAYKGVYKNDEGSEFAYRSSHSGTATVNGEVKKGQIPQSIGSIVEMPRSEVTFDPSTACSTGLHVGTYEYASRYGNVMLKVVFNPRDVVSVPTDASDQKVRVCRYIPIEESEEKSSANVYSFNSIEPPDEDEPEDDDEDTCDCGDFYCDGWNCED